MASLESFQPTVRELKRWVSGIKVIQDLSSVFLDEIAAHVDPLLVDLEPHGQCCFHLRILYRALTLQIEVGVIGLPQ